MKKIEFDLDNVENSKVIVDGIESKITIYDIDKARTCMNDWETHNIPFFVRELDGNVYDFYTDNKETE
jgi:hypothetical protein